MNELLTSPVPSVAGASSNPVPRTQIMFSHTIKGQSYNMPLLAKFLKMGNAPDGNVLPTLLDWELFTDTSGKRTTGFGWYAGGKRSTLVSRSTTC
jgi:alpha-aminoadipic semialdehyde synthase